MPSTNTISPGDYITADKRRTCDRCGTADLAWWKSTRTGRWMLVNTVASQDDIKRARDVRYIAPWSPHRCERVLERRAAREAEMRKVWLRELQRPLFDIATRAYDDGDDDRASTYIQYAARVRAEFEAGTFDGHIR